MTEETLTLGSQQLITRTHEDASSGTVLTYVLRGSFQVATVETSQQGTCLHGQPERYGINREALARALGVAS